jgi:hypothetical protein
MEELMINMSRCFSDLDSNRVLPEHKPGASGFISLYGFIKQVVLVLEVRF